MADVLNMDRETVVAIMSATRGEFPLGGTGLWDGCAVIVADLIVSLAEVLPLASSVKLVGLGALMLAQHDRDEPSRSSSGADDVNKRVPS